MEVTSKMIAIIEYSKRHTDDNTVKEFGITHETLGRYRRAVKGSYNVPKILVFDIENAPTISYVWNTRMWNTSIAPTQLKDDWYMLSWSAKWLYNPEVMTGLVTPEESIKRDDTRIVRELWELFDEADLIIAHNAFKFDIPMCNTAFLRSGLTSPSPYRIEDTLRISKRTFKQTFNSLNYLARFLGLKPKEDTTFELWVDCMAGDQEALDYMLKYNIQDVKLLEEVYFALRGWAYSHVNVNVLQGSDNCCTHCGSPNIKQKGDYTTNSNMYETFRCEECGGYSWQMASGKLRPVAR